MAILNFNASTVAPAVAAEPIPANWYDTVITASEIKPTNDGAGNYLSLELTIIGGEYVNRKLFHNLNIHNANETAVRIAFEQLSAICHAVDVINCVDSQMLHGRPFQSKVTYRGPETGKDGKAYEAKNEIKGFRKTEAMAVTAAPAWAANAAPIGAPAVPAWANNPAPQAYQPPLAAPAQPMTNFAPPQNQEQVPPQQPPAQPWQQPVTPVQTNAPIYQAPPAQQPQPTQSWQQPTSTFAPPIQPSPVADPGMGASAQQAPWPNAPQQAQQPAPQQAAPDAQAITPPWAR